ncbi:MAG: polymer-forming cytoskeletal protein [Steroidobacteraceae bacterium]
MSEASKRRLADNRGGPPTMIGTGAVFRGDLIAPGSLVLSGNVHGDGDIGGTLSIARGAQWEGNVRASNALVAGTLVGDIEVSGALEVGAAALIRGSIVASSLALARGAVVEGQIRITSGQPVVHFEEKRSGGDEP